jgi:hypothetical protein
MPLWQSVGAWMPENLAMRLNELVKALEREIALATSLGVHCTAALLRMARLDLLTHIHAISDEELQAVSDALRANNSGAQNKTHIRGNRREGVSKLPFAATDGTLDDRALHKLNETAQSLKETIYISQMPIRETQALVTPFLGKPYLAVVDGELAIRAGKVGERRGVVDGDQSGDP